MKLHYTIINQNLLQDGRPLLVFLHEGLGSVGQWKDFPQKLSERVQLPALVYDRYGYGQSPDRPETLDARFLHREAFNHLPALISSLKIENPLILFGHSDGGTMALLHASRPHRNLLGVLVEAPHVILEKESFDGIRSARTMLDKPALMERFKAYHGDRSYKLIDEWTALWLSQEGGDWEMREELKRIEHPLCLIQGDEDNFGTFKQLDVIAEEVQSEVVDLHKIEHCGHVPHLQKMDEVLGIAETFIRRLQQD